MREKSIGRSNLKIIVVFAAVILAGVFISQLTGCGEEYRTVCVVETKGVVETVKDKIVYPAYSGMMLQEGYSIETIGDSFVRLVLDGDKYVKLEPGSKLVCEALGTVGSGKTKLSLEKGSMTAELVSSLKDDEEFTVNTPNAVLAVRGTFFRVDLNEVEDGDLVADVLTYGGQVAIRRILPTGKIVNEEVLIDAGYKVRVNMDTKNTVFVVDGIKTVETDKVKVPEPINVRDIPDEDMVDIYFSVQNGHELFISEEETATLIEEREIQIEEYTPVYEKAEIVAEKLEAGEISSIPVIQENEAKSRTSEDTGDPSEDSSDKSSTKDTDTKGSEKEDAKEDSKDKAKDTDTKGSEKEDAKENSKDKPKDTAKGTGGKTSTTIPVVDNTQTTPVAVPTTGTTESGRGDTGNTSGDGSGGESSSSSGGSGSGSGGSSGGESSHTHSYTSSITKQPTCTETGIRTYTCSCGDSYTDDIPIDVNAHTSTNGGTADVHLKCSACGVTLEDGSHHDAPVTTDATCWAAGSVKYNCSCGYVNTEIIPKLEHDLTDIGGGKKHCSRCGKNLLPINSTNFPDTNFQAALKTGSFGYEDDDMIIDDSTGLQNTTVNLSYKSISDITGITYFEKVDTLYIQGNNITQDTQFDILKGLSNLTTLNASVNGFKTLNFTEQTKIITLNASNCTSLEKVNVSGDSSLQFLDLRGDNNLTYINVTGCNANLNIIVSPGSKFKTNPSENIIGYVDTMSVEELE